MKTTHAALSVSLSLAILSSSRGQDYHQLLFDTLTNAPPSDLITSAVPLDNGDELLSIKNGPALRLMRVSSEGVAVWDRIYPGIILNAWYGQGPSSFLFERSNGHLVHAALEDWHYASANMADPDTNNCTFGFSSFGPDGLLDWYRQVNTSFIGLLPILTGTFTTHVTMDEEGSLFLVLHDNDGSWLEVLKVDEEGNLMWSKHLSSPSFYLAPSARPVNIAPDGQGGCFYVLGGSASMPDTRAVHLNASGDVAWAKSFTYLNTVINFEGSGARLASNGDLLVGAMISVPGQGYGYLLRIDPTGTSFQADLYQPYGHIEFAIGDPNDVVVRMGQNYVHLDEGGTVLDAVQLLSTANAGFDHTFEPLGLHWDGSVLSAAGSLRSSDQEFGFTTKRPGVYAFGFDPSSGCALAETQIDHLEVPQAYLSATDLSVEALEHAVDTVTLGTEVLDHAAWTMLSACELITGTEEPTRPNELTVANNPAHGGAPIIVTASAPFMLHLYNTQGACVLANIRGQARVPLPLPTGDLPKGVYYLLSKDMKGLLLGHCKVVVE